MHRMQYVTASGDQYVDLSQNIEMFHLLNHGSNNGIWVIWLRSGIVILIVITFLTELGKNVSNFNYDIVI